MGLKRVFVNSIITVVLTILGLGTLVGGVYYVGSGNEPVGGILALTGAVLLVFATQV